MALVLTPEIKPAQGPFKVSQLAPKWQRVWRRPPIVAFTMQEGGGVLTQSIVKPHTADLVGSNVFFENGQAGRGIRMEATDTDSSAIALGTGSHLRPTRDFTWITYIERIGTGIGVNPILLRFGTDEGSAGEPFLLERKAEGNEMRGAVKVAAGNVNVTDTIAIPNTPTLYALDYEGANARLWRDGREVAKTAATGNLIYDETQLNFGRKETPGFRSRMNVIIYYFFLFDYKWPVAWHQALGLDPFGIIRPQPSIVGGAIAAAVGRIMSSLARHGGLAARGGIAGPGGGLAA